MNLGDSIFEVVIPFWLTLVLSAVPTFFLFRKDRIPPGHCPTCRYCLTGNTSGVCPECGGKVKAMANGEVKTKPPARSREGF